MEYITGTIHKKHPLKEFKNGKIEIRLEVKKSDRSIVKLITTGRYCFDIDKHLNVGDIINATYSSNGKLNYATRISLIKRGKNDKQEYFNWSN